MADKHEWLSSWAENLKSCFKEDRWIKTFDEYLQDLERLPYSLSRNAPQYLTDAIDYFGTREEKGFTGTVKQFKVFDAPFGRPSDQPLFGQESAVQEIYSALKNLVLEGRADRIIHLHGPNGSAKSLIVELLMRGCEEYSKIPEGARYTFHWVFPRERDHEMGFGGLKDGGERTNHTSYANLPSEQLEARIPCDMNDSPLLLLPADQRRELLERWIEGASQKEKDAFRMTHYILEGDLCPRCRQISDTLLHEYDGDVSEVLRHVQVRRYFFSRRYRRGAVVISPQQTPDAADRQLTLDRSLQQLPAKLQHLNFHQLFGDLVDANNGLVEFSDFLTRATEMNKYLLSATERGEVQLSSVNMYTNTVLFASSNERNLDAFKETPEFASFKGRMLLVAVPYLLQWRKERGLCESILQPITSFKHIEPHVAETAALWAVLTRLNKPEVDHFDSDQRDLVRRLTPYQKTLLYDGRPLNKVANFTSQEQRVLNDLVPEIRREYDDTPIYEGRFGVSPREIREIFYDTAYGKDCPCLTTEDVLQEIARFIKDKSLYLFLQLKPEEGYHDPEGFINVARESYLDVLDREVLTAMELVPEGEYGKVFDRYLRHVRAWVRGEKVHNPATGAWEAPNPQIMEEMEEVLDTGDDARRYREEILAKAASWSLEHPDETMDVEALFSGQLQQIAKAYHDRATQEVMTIGQDVLTIGRPEFSGLPDVRKKAATETLDRLTGRFGYCEHCAPRAVAFLLEYRYKT